MSETTFISEKTAYHLACELSTLPEVLESLAFHQSFLVRALVADNPSTPSHVLDILSDDPIDDVIECVAGNPNTSPETLEKLAEEFDYFIILWLSRNPSTPQRIRNYLNVRTYLFASA